MSDYSPIPAFPFTPHYGVIGGAVAVRVSGLAASRAPGDGDGSSDPARNSGQNIDHFPGAIRQRITRRLFHALQFAAVETGKAIRGLAIATNVSRFSIRDSQFTNHLSLQKSH